MKELHDIPWLNSKRKSFKQSKRETVLSRDKYRCVKCGGRECLTVDHIVPLSLGGSNLLANLQTLCQPCNVAKGAAMPENPVASQPAHQGRDWPREYTYNKPGILRCPFPKIEL